jgi:1,4-alpha-glucan branching enzyme
MHDTLTYFSKDPVFRRWHQDELTFAMLYEHHERFVMPLSHDEVVHGKGPLYDKMPGDPWQKLANLRLLFSYQWTRPGKQLLFMGSELAPDHEWRAEQSLDWHLAGDPARAGLMRLLEDLGAIYRASPCLWRLDHDPAGFRWLSCDDRESSVLAHERCDGDARLGVVLNLTPTPRDDYRIGAPLPGRWKRWLSSDDTRYGGSGYPTHDHVDAEDVPWHGRAHSLRLRLPPLGALLLAPAAP